MIADIFINAIYVQDEGLRFGLNFSDGVETIPLHQWNGAQCSDSLGYAPLKTSLKGLVFSCIFKDFRALGYLSLLMGGTRILGKIPENGEMVFC